MVDSRGEDSSALPACGVLHHVRLLGRPRQNVRQDEDHGVVSFKFGDRGGRLLRRDLRRSMRYIMKILWVTTPTSLFNRKVPLPTG